MESGKLAGIGAVAAIGVVVGGICGWLGAQAERRPVTREEIGEVHQRLTAMRADLAQLRQQVAVGRAATPGARPAPAADIAKAEAMRLRGDPAARAEAELAQRAQAAAKEARFRSEPVDARWAPAATSAVQRALAGDAESAQVTARSVECRSQTCRVEMADDGPGSTGSFVPLFAMRVGEVVGSITAVRVDQGRGASALVLYLSR